MKPFDLEAAKRGDPIQCRDGTPAKFVAHVPDADESQRIIVQIRKNVALFHESGWWGKIIPHYSDLFMAPKKRTVWVNFYQSIMAGEVASSAFNTESEADRENEMHNKDRQRMGGRAYPVEIEE